jgi:hypothetical protein
MLVEIPKRLNNCREHEEIPSLEIMSQMKVHGRSVRLARPSNDFGISMKPILQKVKYFLGGTA